MTALNETNYVGTRLRNAREKAGMSKRQLAQAAQVREQQIRQWEAGEHIPTAHNLLRLIPHLGGTMEYYLTGSRK